MNTLSHEDEVLENEEALRIQRLQQKPLIDALKATSVKDMQREFDMVAMFPELVATLEAEHPGWSEHTAHSCNACDVLMRASALLPKVTK